MTLFILSVNFENLTVGLNVLIIFFMLAKIQEDQRLILYVIKQMLKFQVFMI